MNISPYSTSSHFLYWKGTINLVIFVQIEGQTRLKWYDETNRWLVDAIRYTSHPPHASEEAFETLHRQCMSPITVYHPIYCAESVPKIWYIVCKLRVDRCGKYYIIESHK